MCGEEGPVMYCEHNRGCDGCSGDQYQGREFTSPNSTNQDQPGNKEQHAGGIEPCATRLALVDEKQKQGAIGDFSVTVIGAGEEHRSEQESHADTERILVTADALPGTPSVSLKNTVTGKCESKENV